MYNFNSFNDPTVNGSQLSGIQTGMNQAALSANPGVNVTQAQGIQPTSTVTTNATAPTGGQSQNGPGFWSKDGGAGLILGGIQTLGSLWNSYQAHKIAKQQLGFAREQWNTNLANQKQTYNTALEDRIRSRHHTEGKSAKVTDKYLNENKL